MVFEQHGAAGSRGFRQREHGLQHLALSGGLERPVEREPMGKRDQQGSRRADPFGRLAEELDHDGRDPPPLAFRRDQTHGLVAQGSDRNEEGQVHPVLD